MVLNRTIQIRLAREQYERIKEDCQQKGFESLSSYLRHLALHQDDLLHERIRNIHDHIVGPQPTPRKRYKTNPASSPS